MRLISPGWSAASNWRWRDSSVGTPVRASAVGTGVSLSAALSKYRCGGRTDVRPYSGQGRPGMPARRRRAVFALPSVQPGVVVVATSADEGRLGPITLHELKPEHVEIGRASCRERV